MTHLIQVGAGSGGMPVLDLLARDPRITRITLIEPDVYQSHNVVRHLFPRSAVGKLKADLAREWLLERRPDLTIELHPVNLHDPSAAESIELAARSADLGVCAVDNEQAKYHWDALMRRSETPWTLGEVLSGGIGGFVHGFVPGGACYGCVASHLKRNVTTSEPKASDYSQPGGPAPEVTIPASRTAIEVIAALHAQLTLHLLSGPRPPFTSLLFTLEQVPGIFEEAFRPFRFKIARAAECLVCRESAAPVETAHLDAALEQALARLGAGDA